MTHLKMPFTVYHSINIFIFSGLACISYLLLLETMCAYTSRGTEQWQSCDSWLYDGDLQILVKFYVIKFGNLGVNKRKYFDELFLGI